jgi:ABC-type uncharacterized transport system involved in gliding motility auxiliary subunit
MKKKSVISLSGLAFAILLAVFVNVIADVGLQGARIDLTENQLYTLTQGSRNIVSALEEPVTLKLYLSSNLAADAPGLKTYADRIRELLGEYADASNGRLELRIIDPEPFSEAEDEAVTAGLQGVPANAAGDLMYLGLVGTNATDDRRVIPFFHPNQEERLEYDLSRMIYELSDPRRPVVGLMTALPMRGRAPMFPGAPPGSPPWFIVSQMEELFEVRDVDLAVAAIDDDIDILMIVHPKDIAPETLRAIDAFVLGGGNLMLFIDPLSEEDRPPQDPNNPLAAMMANRSSNLDPLLESWGVRMRSDVLVGDLASALRVTTNNDGRPEPVDYVTWLGLTRERMNADDVVTSDLGTLMIPTAGILETLPGANTTIEVLLSTSDQSMEIPVSSVQFMANPAQLLADFVPSGQSYTLAARISGPVRSAYADDEADSDATDDDSGDAEGDAESTPAVVTEGDINVLVVTDVDMLADKWWVRVQNVFGMQLAVPSADNGPFAINGLDNLAGSNDLISIRSRGTFRRPFETMDELRRQADQRYLAKKQELQARLEQTERRINELQSQREDGSSLMLTAEQRAEIDTFRAERVAVRKELREVQHQLQKEIESLQSRLKLINTLLAPLGICVLVGLIATALRRRGRGAVTP